MKKINFDEVKEIIDDYNYIITNRGFSNKWIILCDPTYIIIAPLVKSENKEKMDIDMGEIPTGDFVVFPKYQYIKGKDKYVTVEIIEKRGEYEFYIKRQDILLNDYLDKNAGAEWLKGMAIINRNTLKKYLTDSLSFINTANEHIIEETDLWSVTKIANDIIILQLYNNRDLERIVENSYNGFNIFYYIEREISDRILRNKFVTIFTYMLMSQCNLPITQLTNPARMWLNIVIGGDENNVLFDILHELTKCVNISVAETSNKSNIIKPYYVKEEIENIIQNRFDYSFLIDNREDDITAIRNMLPTKNIDNGKLECMPVLISKTVINDGKYINIDLTDFKATAKMLVGLQDAKNEVLYITKSFYKCFTRAFYESARRNKNIFDRIDGIIMKKYSGLREKRYDYYLLKFFACMEFMFEMYIKFLRPNEDFAYNNWKLLSANVFKSMAETTGGAIEKDKYKDEIERILQEVNRLYENNGSGEHFARSDDEKNGECKGFLHKTDRNSDKMEYICLTNKWLSSFLGIKNEELNSKLQPWIESEKYNRLFRFNTGDCMLRVTSGKKIEGETERFYTIKIDGLKNWITENFPATNE